MSDRGWPSPPDPPAAASTPDPIPEPAPPTPTVWTVLWARAARTCPSPTAAIATAARAAPRTTRNQVAETRGVIVEIAVAPVVIPAVQNVLISGVAITSGTAAGSAGSVATAAPSASVADSIGVSTPTRPGGRSPPPSPARRCRNCQRPKPRPRSNRTHDQNRPASCREPEAGHMRRAVPRTRKRTNRSAKMASATSATMIVMLANPRAVTTRIASAIVSRKAARPRIAE